MCKRILIACAALLCVAADASAGPLRDRLRERRAGCHGQPCTVSHAAPLTYGARYAPPSAPAVAITQAGGCAGGRCPIR